MAKQMTQAQKAEAWRVAAVAIELSLYLGEVGYATKQGRRYVLDVICLFLRRKADAIDRRQTHARREARRRRQELTGAKKGRR